MFHLADFAATVALFITGGTHHHSDVRDRGSTLQTISRERVTEVLMAPTLIQMTLDWLESHPAEAGGARSLSHRDG